jgi:hypothetical protein
VVVQPGLAYDALVGEEKDIVKQVPMPIGEIVIYPITREELEQIEAGGPSSTIFAIMLALVGVGVGGLISILLTGPAPKPPTLSYMLAIILIAVSLVVGVVLALVCWKLPKPVETIIGKVRRREMPPAAMPTSTPPALPAPPVQGAAPTVQVNVIEMEKVERKP